MTLNFFEKTGNIHIVTTAAMEDKVCASVEELEQIYSDWQNAGDRSLPLTINPPCYEVLRSIMRCKDPEHQVKEQEEQKVKGQTMQIPATSEYVVAMFAILSMVEYEL